jgi:hypothetical protein
VACHGLLGVLFEPCGQRASAYVGLCMHFQGGLDGVELGESGGLTLFLFLQSVTGVLFVPQHAAKHRSRCPLLTGQQFEGLQRGSCTWFWVTATVCPFTGPVTHCMTCQQVDMHMPEVREVADRTDWYCPTYGQYFAACTQLLWRSFVQHTADVTGRMLGQGG